MTYKQREAKSLKIANVIITFCNKHRQYRTYDSGWLYVDKVWNRGMGNYQIMRVSINKNIVYIAKDRCNKVDRKHLIELLDMLGKAFNTVYYWEEVDGGAYPNYMFNYPESDKIA